MRGFSLSNSPSIYSTKKFQAIDTNRIIIFQNTWLELARKKKEKNRMKNSTNMKIFVCFAAFALVGFAAAYKQNSDSGMQMN